MTKHKPETMTVCELINAMPYNSDSQWYELLGVGSLIDLRNKAMASDDAADWERLDSAESELLKSRGESAVVVMWPEHVLTPRINGDASYNHDLA